MVATFTSFAAGDWTDHNTWLETFPNPGHPSPDLPGAGDLVSIDAPGVYTGNASVTEVMIVDASVTFSGNVSTSDSLTLTGFPGLPTALIANGGLSAANLLQLGNSTTLIANSNIVGPNSGTHGIQNFGVFQVNGGSVTANLVNSVGTFDLEGGGATFGTFDVGAPLGGGVGSLIAKANISDTLGMVSMVNQGSAAATISGGVWSNQQLTIGYEGTANVTVNAGGEITATGGTANYAGQQALTVGDLEFGKATLAVDGGLAEVTGDLGVGLKGIGTLQANAGGEITVSGSLEAGGTGSIQTGGTAGTAEFDINSGTLTVGTNATVGDAASGSMTLTGGGGFSAGGPFTLGAQASGTGTLALSGADSWVTAEVMVIGGAGTGVATVGNQSHIATGGDVIIGQAQGNKNSGGTLTVNAGGSLSAGGNLTVGDGGTGSLAVAGGAVSLTGSAFVVGNAASGNGDVSIQTSTVSVLGTVTVGNLGRAGVSVNTQGDLDATSIVLGAAIGGNGGFALDGSGSSAHSGDITIGAAGVGALQVTNSAVLSTTGGATIASQGGPVQQTVTVDTKGNWGVGVLLDVGRAGSGDLAVQGGGQVSAGQVVVADALGADGTIAVSGTNGGIASALSYGGTLEIGGNGTGTLLVTGGGSVGPGTAGTGTVDIGAMNGGTGTVSLADPDSRLTAQVLAVGGTDAGPGGSGALTIGTGATVAVSSATIWRTGSVAMTGGVLLTDPITDDGVISGFGTITGTMSNAGSITAEAGTLALAGSLSGAGGVSIDTGGTLRLELGAGLGETIDMAAGGASLVLDDLADTKATIAGFAAGDTIAVNGISADGKDYSDGILTLTEAGQAVGSLAISGGFSTANFNVASNGSVTTITLECFASGTRIATSEGDVAVEHLRIGDLVVTVDDTPCEPIIWIGHRTVNCRAHPSPETVWPVRIAAGAFGIGLPARDLFLSPDHAIWVNAVLVPAKLLMNGTSIARVKRDRITYFHLELQRHAVILAEQLAVESYLDTGERANFDRAGSVIALHPDFSKLPALDTALLWETRGAAPLILGGPQLTAARRAVWHAGRASAVSG